MKVSIIIPVHNASKTLDRALGSILNFCNRDFDLEIILIENGSTDNSIEIIEEYKNRFPGIVRRLDSELGVSKARNVGLKNATGELLTFLDADDYIDMNVFSHAIANCRHEIDIVFFNYFKGSNEQRIFNSKKEFLNSEYNDFINELISNPTCFLTVWGKIYRTDAIKLNNIQFDETMALSEDSDFLIKLLLSSNALQVSDLCFYHYSIDTPSVTRSYNPQKVVSYIKSLKETEKKYLGDSRINGKSLSKYILMNFNVMSVKEIMTSSSPLSFTQKVSELDKLVNDDIFKTQLDNLNVKDFKGLRFLPILLIKFKFVILAAIVYRIRSFMNERLMNSRRRFWNG